MSPRLIRKWASPGIELIAFADGAYVDGIYEEGAITNTPILAVSQPLTGQELDALPEGERVKKTRKFLMLNDIETTLGRFPRKGDKISEGIDTYKLELVIVNGKPLPHTKAIGIKLDE